MHRLGILAHRPARVNVSYLGYPAPTGIRQFDFRLTDRNCVPSAANRFTGPEAVYAMNGPFFCYSARLPRPPIAPTPSLASRHITFGLFTTLKKIRPMMISLYARILRQVPHSRLLIKAPGADDPIVQRAAHTPGNSHPPAPTRIASNFKAKVYSSTISWITLALISCSTPSPSTATPPPAIACTWASPLSHALAISSIPACLSRRSPRWTSPNGTAPQLDDWPEFDRNRAVSLAADIEATQSHATLPPRSHARASPIAPDPA